MSDPVNHPPHYESHPSGVECIDVVEHMNFNRGNAMKYLWRAGEKNPEEEIQDLKKARWYVGREIERLTGGEPSTPQPPGAGVLFYLATPYSKYPAGIDGAWADACKLTARLLVRGVRCYSPIAHTHPLAVHGNLDPLDHSIWLPFDESMMEKADALIVARMDGWEESKGIAHEIAFFEKAGKPIFDLDPGTLEMVAR